MPSRVMSPMCPRWQRGHTLIGLLIFGLMILAGRPLSTSAQTGAGSLWTPDRHSLYEGAVQQWEAQQPAPPRRGRHPRTFPWVGRHPIVRYNPISLLLSTALYGYQQVLSPQIQAECAYHVSCSAFARGAIGRYGPLKGVALSADRLTRCNRLSAADVPEIARDGQGRLYDGPVSESAVAPPVSPALAPALPTTP